MKGYIHLYTGNGKGKTTAAAGLAMRAAGAGKNVFIGQFVKGMKYSEIDLIEKSIRNISVKQFGLDCFIINEPTKNDIQAARKGLEESSKVIYSGNFEVVILDEVTIALYYNLFSADELIAILDNKPEHVEIILTGRYAPESLVIIADLVTEMKEVKHYFNKGIQARKGIEF